MSAIHAANFTYNKFMVDRSVYDTVRSAVIMLIVPRWIGVHSHHLLLCIQSLYRTLALDNVLFPSYRQCNTFLIGFYYKQCHISFPFVWIKLTLQNVQIIWFLSLFRMLQLLLSSHALMKCRVSYVTSYMYTLLLNVNFSKQEAPAMKTM